MWRFVCFSFLGSYVSWEISHWITFQSRCLYLLWYKTKSSPRSWIQNTDQSRPGYYSLLLHLTELCITYKLQILILLSFRFLIFHFLFCVSSQLQLLFQNEDGSRRIAGGSMVNLKSHSLRPIPVATEELKEVPEVPDLETVSEEDGESNLKPKKVNTYLIFTDTYNYFLRFWSLLCLTRAKH